MTQVLLFTELMDNSVAARAAGAYRIATEIRKNGYTCQVVDFFTSFSEEEHFLLIDKFVNVDTLIVGFSSTFFNYVDTELNDYNKVIKEKNILGATRDKFVKMLPTINFPYHPSRMSRLKDRIKTRSPNCKLVLGGAKAQFLNSLNVDTFITGYGDSSIINYLNFLKQPKIGLKNLKIFKNGQAAINDKGFESFDFANSSIEWHESDMIQFNETLPIEIARGCIFKCKFCAFPLNGKKNTDHIKSSTVLREEFIRNYEKWGITNYIYADDTHNDSIHKLNMMADIVTSLPFKLSYASYLRHDLIHAHPETIQILKHSGLVSAVFGIETLNHKSGKAIGKGLHPDKIKELLIRLRSEWGTNIAMSSGFIVGLPYDTPETVEQWSNWVLSTECPLDGFTFEGLFLNKPKFKTWLSEFELNSQKYGYTVDEFGQWSNSVFTRESAANLAKDIQSKAINLNRIKYSAFNLLMLRNSGLSHEYLRSTPINKISSKWLFEQKNKRIQEYKNKILN